MLVLFVKTEADSLTLVGGAPQMTDWAEQETFIMSLSSATETYSEPSSSWISTAHTRDQITRVSDRLKTHTDRVDQTGSVYSD